MNMKIFQININTSKYLSKFIKKTGALADLATNEPSTFNSIVELVKGKSAA